MSNSVEFYLKQLEDSDPMLRIQAADVLGELGDPQSVDLLIKHLIDEYNGVQIAAAEALGKLGDNRALPHLMPLLHSNDRDVQLTAAVALSRLGERKAINSLLENFLIEPDDDDRLEVARTLEACGVSVVDILLIALSDPNQRYYAVTTLGDLGMVETVPLLTSLLKDEDSELRYRVIRTLGKLGGPEILPTLEKIAAQDSGTAWEPWKTVRSAALEAIQLIKRRFQDEE